ncbi:MAG: cyclase/dehydrase [Phycisphaerales bacterium]|jgi:uncharacterized membrane protein|nr:cyclase/dehydrase [Phycisphaerales bacterium]MDB5303795.1 cyclase/dehydrase [Phycisphaerales bacterium]
MSAANPPAAQNSGSPDPSPDRPTTDTSRGGERASGLQRPETNVPAKERWISGITGGALLLTGLRMRSLPGAVIALVGGAMLHRGYTGHCHGYQALGINRARGEGAPPEEYFERGIHVSESVTIDKPAEELYRFWRDVENLPRVMGHLESVRKIDEKRSHWAAKAPAGITVEWDAEIINDEPNRIIAWRSLYPASVDNAGSVRFLPAPDGRGTEVIVTLDYIPPAGRVGAVIAMLFGKDPGVEIREDLRRFKAMHAPA